MCVALAQAGQCYGPKPEPRTCDQSRVKPESAALLQGHHLGKADGLAPGDLLPFFLNNDNDLALCFPWHAKVHADFQ